MLICETVDQGMLAEHVDDARNSSCMPVNTFDRFRREQRPVACSRNSQALCDVTLRFLHRQRARLASHGDPLPKLPQVRLPQLFFKLGLARKDNLQEFFRRRFEIRKKPDFFQYLVGEALRLIYDEHRRLSAAVPVQ